MLLFYSVGEEYLTASISSWCGIFFYSDVCAENFLQIAIELTMNK
jgi:hypothetical protein